MKRLLSVNIAAVVHEGEWTGSVGRTGIDKRPVEHRILVANDHVEGDAVLDVKSHGGRDKAVYAYAREDGDWWENQLGIQIGNGRFGENLTTQGIELGQLPVGTTLRLGDDVIIALTGFRDPCSQIDKFQEGLRAAVSFKPEVGPQLFRNGVMSVVVRGGTVRVGDTIKVALPAGPHQTMQKV